MLERLITDEAIFIFAFILFERIIMKNSLDIKKMNFHKLMFVAVMISHK